MSIFDKLRPVKGTKFDSSRVEVEPRDKFIAAVEDQIKLFNGDTAVQREPTFKIIGNEVAVSFRYGNTAVKFPNGEKKGIVHVDDFQELAEATIKRAEDKELDDELKALAAEFRARMTSNT